MTSVTRGTRKAPPVGITLDPLRSVHLHRQIGEHFRQAILERRLIPGARLPSSRLIAKELNCSRGTVLMALDQLVAEGYIVPRPGSGMAVAANLPEDMLVSPKITREPGSASIAAPELPARTIALAERWLPTRLPVAFPVGQPDRSAFPFPLWAKLLEREWRRPGWEVAGVPHPFGHFRLRTAIASYLGASRGITCTAQAVVVTSGVRQGVSLFARTVLDIGAEVWIEEPSFSGIQRALTAIGALPVPIPVDEGGFQPELALAMAPNARLAVVAPSHQFPLGGVLSLPRRLALLSWARRCGGWIIEDDFEGEYRYAGRPLAPLRALDETKRVAYLGSFSKLLFPALRLSFLVLPDPLVEVTERILDSISTPAPLLGQGALARFIEDGHFTAHLRRTRTLYASRQQALLAASKRHLSGLLDVAADPGGMQLISKPNPATLPSFDDFALASAAASDDLSVTPLSMYYSGPVKHHGLILGYASTPEPEIDPAAARLARLVQTARPARLQPKVRR